MPFKTIIFEQALRSEWPKDALNRLKVSLGRGVASFFKGGFRMFVKVLWQGPNARRHARRACPPPPPHTRILYWFQGRSVVACWDFSDGYTAHHWNLLIHIFNRKLLYKSLFSVYPFSWNLFNEQGDELMPIWNWVPAWGHYENIYGTPVHVIL